jgi:TrbC/VIRB2 pilin
LKEAKVTKRHSRIRAWLKKRQEKNFNLTAIRNALVVGAAMAMTPMADAQYSSSGGGGSSYFSSVTNLVCGISSTVSGPWLYAVSIIVIILGAIAIAASDSSIVKMISTVFIGLGIAASAGTVVANGMGITSGCMNTMA